MSCSDKPVGLNWSCCGSSGHWSEVLFSTVRCESRGRPKRSLRSGEEARPCSRRGERTLKEIMRPLSWHPKSARLSGDFSEDDRAPRCSCHCQSGTMRPASKSLFPALSTSCSPCAPTAANISDMQPGGPLSTPTAHLRLLFARGYGDKGYQDLDLKSLLESVLLLSTWIHLECKAPMTLTVEAARMRRTPEPHVMSRGCIEWWRILERVPLVAGARPVTVH